MGLREKYEAHHKCKYTPEAIKAAVHLSARYIADRYLPDKAIDLIDEAGSRAHIQAFRRKKAQETCIHREACWMTRVHPWRTFITLISGRAQLLLLPLVSYYCSKIWWGSVYNPAY